MSMPYSIIECENCQKKWYTYQFWGRESYRLPDGCNLPIERAAGWCKCCDNFSNIEKLPTAEEINNKLTSLWCCWGDQKTIKAYIIFGFVRLTQLFKLRFNEQYQNELKQTQALVDWHKSRKSSAKCLTCGSTEVQEANLWGDDRKEPIRHPNCGGRFRLEESDERIAMCLKHRIYDVEGSFLFEEDEDF